MKLGIWVTLGGSNWDKPRGLAWGLSENGYMGAGALYSKIESAVGECLSKNIHPIVILHNPFGIEKGEAMDFDQQIEAAGLPVGDFGEWLEKRVLPLVAPDGEVITYLGVIQKDKDFTGLTADEYIARAGESLKSIPLGCSLGADVGGNLKETDPGYAVWLMQKNLGRKVWVERRPLKEAATKSWPVIEENKLWIRNPDSGQRVEEVSELIRFVVRNFYPDESIRLQAVSEVLADGHIPAVEFGDVEAATELMT